MATRHTSRLLPTLPILTIAAATVLGACSDDAPTDSWNDRVVSVRAAALEADVRVAPEPPEVPDALGELGQALAFDKLLSGNGNISCLSCHHPTKGTGDARALSLGEGGTGLGESRRGGPVIPRNAPALFNLHLLPTMFWDSRVELAGGRLFTPAGDQITDEMEATFDYGMVSAQAMFPVTSRHEMRGDLGTNDVAEADDRDFALMWSRLMERLLAVPRYRELFAAAYPDVAEGDLTFAHAANALAAFEIAAFAKTDSPWNRFLEGDPEALTEEQLRGAEVFFEAGCANCHRGTAFTDGLHHNTCLAQFGPGKGHGDGLQDFGREGVTGREGDRYDFRTPTLLNVELTAPYGHAGQYGTLETFVEHYCDPAESLRTYWLAQELTPEEAVLLEGTTTTPDVILERIDPAMDFVDLNCDDVPSVVAFLEALTDDSARDLTDTVPTEVPSGLPVED